MTIMYLLILNFNGDAVHSLILLKNINFHASAYMWALYVIVLQYT